MVGLKFRAPTLTTMDHSAKSATTVKDPVCGMNVEPSTAKHKLDHAGKTYYFCCARCLEKFRARPNDYLAPRPAAAAELQTIDIAPAAGPQERRERLQRQHRPAQAASPISTSTAQGAYVCPMCPEVRSAKPDACPRCGMALEPEMPAAATRVEYTCPMHPEIVRPGPGHCPICGMALEPRTVTAQEEDNPELREMTRRFWISLALTAPLLAIAMADMLPGMPVQRCFPPAGCPGSSWCWPRRLCSGAARHFFSGGGCPSSIARPTCSRSSRWGRAWPTCTAWSRPSFPQIFPASFREMSGRPAVYFEAAAAITTLVLLGQVLELRARSRTGAAIRALLDLTPKTARVLRDGREEDIPLEQVMAGRPVAGASGGEDSGGWHRARRHQRGG